MVPGCITNEVENIYSIGTLQGEISVGYTRNQFELAKANILSPSMIPPQQITQTEVMQKTSLGIGPNACRCIKCNTTRCPCRKVSRHCTTKCHIGKSCLNKQCTISTLTVSFKFRVDVTVYVRAWCTREHTSV